MGWSTKQIMLAIVMVVTGTINTLSTKWADNLDSIGVNKENRQFNHPFFQANCMFLGETLCLLAFLVMMCFERHQRRTETYRRISSLDENLATVRLDENGVNTKCPCGFNPLYFYIPAICDMTGTTLMYIGLTMTYASSFQMLRGALIIFTGLLSVGFLNRTLQWFQWTGMAIVIFGLAVVGVSDIVTVRPDDQDVNAIITGDLLIILAQIVTATQMVIEEKLLAKFSVKPLLVVGFEGIFGFITMTFLLIPFYYIHAGKFSTNPEHRLEDVPDAFTQMENNWRISLAIILNILSISFFNFAGVSVTKELSATTRTVLDSIRTLFVWVVSLAVGWQKFYFLQIIGYILLVLGMFIYNDVLIVPLMRKYGLVKDQRNSQTVEGIVNETSTSG